MVVPLEVVDFGGFARRRLALLQARPLRFRRPLGRFFAVPSRALFTVRHVRLSPMFLMAIHTSSDLDSNMLELDSEILAGYVMATSVGSTRRLRSSSHTIFWIFEIR